MATSYFTSESVTRGHPDKLCDQIADRILDEILRQDPESHVACEVTACTDQVHIFGEITTDAKVDYEETAREVIREIGYTQPGRGFDAESCRITVSLREQSPDILPNEIYELFDDIGKELMAVDKDTSPRAWETKEWMKTLAIPEHLIGWPFVVCPLVGLIVAGISVWIY